MTANDVVLVASTLERERKQLAPHIGANDFANFYTANVHLRPDNLSAEEIFEGIVDGGKDCGIDALYIFVNNLHLRDDTPLTNFGRNARIHLKIVQCKNSAGFTEAAIDKLIIHLPGLLEFSRDETQLAKIANPKLLEITGRFLRAYQQLDMPELQISLAFISTKATQAPHDNVRLKADQLKVKLSEVFGAATTSVDFLDARELLVLSLATPHVVKRLPLAENPISTSRAGGYVALVALDAYGEFISAQSGELDTSLFEANVRDYEGETTVNSSIQDSLARPNDDVDFWWLNNGITIVADRVQLANKMLELESPQIVNGLQTSTEIYKGSPANRQSDRGVLVKVIEASDAETRDRIIRATNSQTSFGPSALKATDYAQRQIEEYLGYHGFFYERRRRQYQNLNRPLDKIISIDQMGQAVLSALVQAPHVARGNLSQVYDNEIYPLLFSPNHPLEMYLASLQLYRACREFLSGHPNLRPHIEDFQFHLTSIAAISLTRKDKPGAKDLGALLPVQPHDTELLPLLNVIQNEYRRGASGRNLLLFDQLAKNASVADGVVQAGRRRMRATSRLA